MCNGDCNQGRNCDCAPSGMTIVLGVAVLYGMAVGAALMWIGLIVSGRL